MKTPVNILLMFCLLMILTSGQSFGQNGFKANSTKSIFLYGDSLANPSGDGSLVESRVSQPALMAFAKSFRNSTNAKWYRLNQYYLVHFTKNENENKALYDVKGNLKYSVLYGGEKDLPRDIRRMVKREYVE